MQQFDTTYCSNICVVVQLLNTKLQSFKCTYKQGDMLVAIPVSAHFILSGIPSPSHNGANIKEEG
jgi:hypothetical protein